MFCSIVDVDLSNLIETPWWCRLTCYERLNVVRKIAYQVLRALCFMHVAGIAHLDVKRKNYAQLRQLSSLEHDASVDYTRTVCSSS